MVARYGPLVSPGVGIGLVAYLVVGVVGGPAARPTSGGPLVGRPAGGVDGFFAHAEAAGGVASAGVWAVYPRRPRQCRAVAAAIRSTLLDGLEW